MSKRVTSTPKPPPQSDQDFDAYLADVLRDPKQDDTAMLSRSVLSAIAAEDAGQSQNGSDAEVLSEPLAWGAGFGLLMLGLGILGYAAIPVLDGGMLVVLTEISGLTGLLGGS